MWWLWHAWALVIVVSSSQNVSAPPSVVTITTVPQEFASRDLCDQAKFTVMQLLGPPFGRMDAEAICVQVR